MILPTLFVLASLDASAASPELKMVMADPRLPNKPTTHILDDRVSTGIVENFRELYVNPAQVGKSLQPVGKLGPVGRMLSPSGEHAVKITWCPVSFCWHSVVTLFQIQPMPPATLRTDGA